MTTARQESPWIASPYLHLFEHAILNPHTGRGMGADHPWYSELRNLILNETHLATLDQLHTALAADDWLISKNTDLSHHFRLRWVSLEAHSICNQRCFFCPVSVAPRDPYFMPTALFERIVDEVAALGEPIEAVTMIQYNEPTIDRRFVDQVHHIKDSGLPPAVLSNGSNLVPETVDALVAMGGLHYFSVNLSTLDREQYARDRGKDHLDQVLANLDYAKDKSMAEEMVVVVLGTDPEEHARQFEAISRRFAGSRFKVQDFEPNDRAGYLDIGLAAEGRELHVRGCDYMGSRPIEHLHIAASAKAVICCQDYEEGWVLGDLENQSVQEVLEGEPFAQARRMVYGLETPPDDFICSNCRYALRR
jgi:pyruvate-formate lyase-activating enzyme